MKCYEPIFSASGQYIGMGVPAEDQTKPVTDWAPSGAKFFVAAVGDSPADGTIDGDGVWHGGLWHPNPPDPLDKWMLMEFAPKDGTRILALVTEGQFYPSSSTPNELIPVVVRWIGEHEQWSMIGHGGLKPTLWLPIRLTG